MVPSPGPNVEADATVELRLPKVPSGLAPASLVVVPFHWPKAPSALESVAVVPRSVILGPELAPLPKVSQPATSVSAEANAVLVAKAPATMKESLFFIIRVGGYLLNF